MASDVNKSASKALTLFPDLKSDFENTSTATMTSDVHNPASSLPPLPTEPQSSLADSSPAAMTSDIDRSASRLIVLPAELKHKITEYFKFPDLLRLSQTCQHFRSLIPEHVRYKSLLQLEQDWFDAGEEFKSTQPNDGWTTTRYEGEDVLQLLKKRGYASNEVEQLMECAFCRGCNRFRRIRQFAICCDDCYSDPLSFYFCHIHGDCEPKYCIACLRKFEGRPNQRHPWIINGEISSVFCSRCKVEKQTCLETSEFQRQCAMCDECWQDEMVEWESCQQTLSRQKEETKDLLDRIERYEIWMRRTKRGYPTYEDGGFVWEPETDGLDVPEWEYLRAGWYSRGDEDDEDD